MIPSNFTGNPSRLTETGDNNSAPPWILGVVEVPSLQQGPIPLAAPRPASRRPLAVLNNTKFSIAGLICQIMFKLCKFKVKLV